MVANGNRGAYVNPNSIYVGIEPGSATLPFYGVEPALMDPTASTPTEVEEEGHLTFKRPWPGIMRRYGVIKNVLKKFIFRI